MNVTLVHNPAAGDGGPGAAALTELVQEAGHTVHYRDSNEELDRALAEARDVVVVAGGDGTLGKVLRSVNAKVPVAIVPLGSANNIAHALGQVASAEVVVRGLELAERRRFDVGWTRGPWGRRRFVEGVGIGPLARALAAGEAADVPGDGSVRFGRAAFAALLGEVEPCHVRITLDDEELVEAMGLVEVLNIDRIGPRLRLAPEADPSDGLLDVLCVPHAELDAVRRWTEAADDSPPPGLVRRAKRVSIRCDRAVVVHVDDEIPATGDAPFTIELGLEEEPLVVLIARVEGGADA